VVEHLTRGISTNIQVIGDFSNTALLNEVTYDPGLELLQTGLGDRHTHGRSSVDTDTFIIIIKKFL
jgi:hypothetical protein